MKLDTVSGRLGWKLVNTKTELNILYIDPCLHLEESRCAKLKDWRVYNRRLTMGMSIEGAVCRLLTLIVMLFIDLTASG